MIVVRDVFRLRFGRAREAVALWQEALGLLRESGDVLESRLLTDVTGPYYTLVVETAYADLAAWERTAREGMADPRFRDWYARFTPLAESGQREIMSVVGSDLPALGRSEAQATAAR